jgi:hypothetical protein
MKNNATLISPVFGIFQYLPHPRPVQPHLAPDLPIAPAHFTQHQDRFFQSGFVRVALDWLWLTPTREDRTQVYG